MGEHLTPYTNIYFLFLPYDGIYPIRLPLSHHKARLHLRLLRESEEDTHRIHYF